MILNYVLGPWIPSVEKENGGFQRSDILRLQVSINSTSQVEEFQTVLYFFDPSSKKSASFSVSNLLVSGITYMYP